MEMIKATELRIGNWVYPFDDIEYVDNKTIKQDSIRVSYQDLENTHFLEPIPITPEWLERLGFEIQTDPDDYQLITKGNFRFIFEPDTKIGKGYFFNDLKLNSINQLQNLYHALTGEELETKEGEQ